ncbi:Dpy-30 motif, partial [Popillia japonica]
GTHYAEEHMLRRLSEFRNNNTDDNTVLNFFDEMEIHPIIFDVTTYRDANMEDILKSIYDKLGAAVGFGPTLEEEIELHQCTEEEARLKEQEANLEQKLLEEKALEEYQSKMEQWTRSLENLQKEEEKLIIAQSEPLRNYLMKYVVPTLTKGLIEVASCKPPDPVDHLAEYLFRENPEGHMFDPSFTRAGELIAQEQTALQKE